MSKSHKHNLPRIKSLLFPWGVEHAWVEPVAGYGERPDVLGMVGRDGPGPWDAPDREGPIKLYAGQTIVCEYKETRQDLEADYRKPWRQPDKLALGDWRYYWFRRDGGLRPELVPEATGWGVVMFDESTATVARPSLRFARVARWQTTNLIASLVLGDARRAMAELRAAQASELVPSTRGNASVADGDRDAYQRSGGGRYEDKVARAAEAIVGECPVRTADLKRELERDHGWSGSAGKLEAHLRKHSRALVPPPSAGGNWTLKDTQAA